MQKILIIWILAFEVQEINTTSWREGAAKADSKSNSHFTALKKGTIQYFLPPLEGRENSVP